MKSHKLSFKVEIALSPPLLVTTSQIPELLFIALDERHSDLEKLCESFRVFCLFDSCEFPVVSSSKACHDDDQVSRAVLHAERNEHSR
jgi:hypothetical protein